MSKINNIIKKGIDRLIETKGFEDMEVAFGVEHKSNNLSDAEKNQFGPMGNLKKSEGGSFKNPITNGMREVNKAQKEGGANANEYYKEVAKKIRDFQVPGKSEIDAPKVPTNAKDGERIKTTGYDVGISGMEVTSDLAGEKGGSDATTKQYRDRVDNLNKGDNTYDTMKKNAKDTNQLKYKKEANNTRPVKSQKSPQPMAENTYRGVDNKNIFKANGKLVSEEQVIKLANKVPSRVKIDETVFAITDGENSYKLIWEGDTKTGEPVITNFKNTEMVNEDLNKMKHLWNFNSKDSISTKKTITESGEDAFKRIFNKMRDDSQK